LFSFLSLGQGYSNLILTPVLLPVFSYIFRYETRRKQGGNMDEIGRKHRAVSGV
jgi:hypothetical protein